MTHANRTVALTLVIAAGVAGCGDDNGGSGGADRPAETVDTVATTPDPVTTETMSTTADETTAGTERFEVTIRNGQPAGGPGRWRVDRGSSVVITISSDVADEVHLHDYDVSVDVEPGEPADLELTADQPGVYEVELEDSNIVLGNLVVS